MTADEIGAILARTVFSSPSGEGTVQRLQFVGADDANMGSTTEPALAAILAAALEGLGIKAIAASSQAGLFESEVSANGD